MASGAQAGEVGLLSLDKNARLSYWLPGNDAAGARDGSWVCLCFTLFYLDAKPSHMGVYVDRPACRLHWPMGYV
jgi:hypothetical protein